MVVVLNLADETVAVDSSQSGEGRPSTHLMQHFATATVRRDCPSLES